MGRTGVINLNPKTSTIADGRGIEYLKLLVVLLLALVVRIYAGRNVLQNGNVLFLGYDEFYHLRRILYTVSHFPNTIWFDSYIDYPNGNHVLWPPFFDQLLAGFSLALGQHSQHGIEMVAAIVPAVLGSLATVIVYFMVKEIFDRRTALMSAFMTTLAPYYLLKSMLGADSHHWLVVLCFILAVMFMILAISRKEGKYLFATMAGIAMVIEAYTWLASSAYFGVFLIYAFVQMTLDLKEGVSSRNTVITMMIPFGLTLVFTLPFLNEPWLFPSFFGAAIIMAGMAALFVVSKIIAERRIHYAAFPIVIILFATIFIMVSMNLTNFWIFSNVNNVIFSGANYLFSGQMTGEIAEAEPLFADQNLFFSGFILSNLGWNLVLTVIGLAVLAWHMWHSWGSDEKKKPMLLFLIFAVFTLILTIGQIRFLELLSITTGILISMLFIKGVDKIETRMTESNYLSKFLIIIMFLLLILPTVSEALYYTNTIPEIAGDWYDTLNWLEKQSNATSYYDNPDKNPEYSVMDTWEEGNWIIYIAKRPVVANNFQTGIKDSSEFYLSDNEETAARILDARRSRYVITDYDLLYSKFPAIAAWADKNQSEYQKTEYLGRYIATTPTRKLLQTTLASLQLGDGSYMGRFRLIYESHTMRGQKSPTGLLKIFEYVPGAVIKVTAEPGMKVKARLNLVSNQGRTFQYANEGTEQGNQYEIRVPYSTEKRYDTHAVEPYHVFLTNTTSIIKTVSVNVTEEDVLKGMAIDVKM